MRKYLLSALIVTFALLGCSKGKEAVLTDPLATEIDASDPNLRSPADLYSDPNGKIIKTADYRFEVTSVKKSQEVIEGLVRKYGAHISSSTLELEHPVLEAHLTLRVPGNYFDQLLKEIDGQALYVNYRRIKTDDVTKEFVDLDSRLRTKREVEQRYMDILRKKAGTIPEVLDAEQKIGQLHEEIEATISRINYLNEQVRYSTINLEIYQPVPITERTADIKPGREFGKELAEAFSSGFSGAVQLLIGLTYLWPLMVVGGVTYGILRRKKSRIEKLRS